MMDFLQKTYGLILVILLAGCSAEPVAGAPDSPKLDFLEKTVITYNSVWKQRFVNNHQVYTEGWDTLAQAKFWQEVMALTHDSVIVNVAAHRQLLFKIPTASWHCQTEGEKSLYKQNVCINHQLEVNTNIFITSGKKFFFEFRKALPMIASAIPVFERNNTDPWYAQTILLIESPGKTDAVSYVGARGPFQLMPYVARQYGLVVTKSRDDRTDLEMSASASAKFIGTVCIPLARKILDGKSIKYNEKDLWFRLFVMHIYHAGAGNVSAVVNKIDPQEGGMPLIRKMWQTEAAGFKNESQNYSQIALAAIISFDKLIAQDSDTIHLVHGDKNMKLYSDKNRICVDTLAFLNECLEAYGADLVDGMIPYDYFVTSADRVNAEIARYQKLHPHAISSTPFSYSEKLFGVGNELMYKRKFNEAILIFQLGLQYNPISPSAYDSLGKAYKALGKSDLALKYTRKSKEVIENPDSFLK